MRFNRTTDYAIRCMLCIAQAEHGLNSAEISEITGISRNMLINLLQRLRRAGLVRSARGAMGGYVLVGTPGDISLLQIVRVTEPGQAISPAMTKGANGSAIDRFYHTLQRQVIHSLDQMTLEQLLEEDGHGKQAAEPAP